MAANPYLTVPAGTPSQQALWLQSYYRNAALAQSYANQPTWQDYLAKGLTTGIAGGVQTYLDGVQDREKADNAYNLAFINQGGEMDRLQYAAGARSAEAEAQRRAAMRTTFLKGQAQTALWSGVQPQAQPDVPDYGNPLDPGAFPAYGMKSQPPTPGMAVGDVLQGMGPLAGYVGHEDIAAATKGQSDKISDIEKLMRMSQEAANRGDLMLAKEYARRAGYAHAQMTPDPKVVEERTAAGARVGAAGLTSFDALPLGQRALMGKEYMPAKPTAPKEPNLTEGFMDFLVGKGYESIPDFLARTSPADRERLQVAYKDDAEARQKRVQLAGALNIDQRQRANKADEGINQLSTISAAVEAIEPVMRQVLEPGVLGRLKGGIKTPINQVLQFDPLRTQLESMSAGMIGNIARQINREVGVMTDQDIMRAQRAFGVTGADSLEVGAIKLRALRAFAMAAEQSWEVYRQITFQTPLDEVRRMREAVRQQFSTLIGEAEKSVAAVAPPPGKWTPVP